MLKTLVFGTTSFGLEASSSGDAASELLMVVEWKKQGVEFKCRNDFVLCEGGGFCADERFLLYVDLRVNTVRR